MATPDTQSIPLAPAQRWRAYWVCVAVAGLTILDLTKVNVALPSIEEAFAAGSTELQLIVSGYVLAFGLTLVPAGRIGDQRSRKALFVIGLSAFLVTSALCALAPNVTVLLIARLLQGVAAGIQMPQVLGLVQQLFQGEERGRAFGLFGATIGLATAFGPTLGGFLIAVGGATDGWRWIFWMNVPLVVIAIVFAVKLLPGPPDRPARRLELDPFGLLLFAITVVSLMWPFLFTTGSPDDNPARWWTLIVFVLGLTAFIAWERHYARTGRHPLVPLSLFGISSYRNGTALATAFFSAMPPTFLLTTLYLQQGLGLEPVYAGMVTIGFALTSAIASWWGGNLVNRLGRPLVVWGIVILLVGISGLVLVALFTPPEVAPWAMAGTMAVAGFGGGFVISPNQTLALADIPVKQGGLAGSVGQLGQRVGTAVGTAVGLSLFYATIWREAGGNGADLEVYHHAYGYGMLAVALFLAVALAIGFADLGSRRRQRRGLG
ncbi:MFS transporter [Agromyces aerolatus]|uniref:MFS transporter n=1 Tax=Agromyces sp. LY-1074 TaxID=3074080 RepID=UPI00285FB80D|nr:MULTISPECIES: MFS transporter [unclassified Agromyces]MDR5699792.1 MFS transporter [Agromyces sp. LY-1074]MDR5706088.1 MFS transporter [Agromyces sp. LY-1358]